MKLRRQGDVLIQAVDSIPEGVKKLNHLVLAEGETTGHKHQVINGEAELFEKDGTLYLSIISETAVVSHEEHKAQTLPKGNYRILIQQDYQPNGWKRVTD